MKKENKELRLETVENTIKHRIYIIRGHKVMLDSDLAKLYGIETKRLNEQVKRNSNRFPDDFMFQLTIDDVEYLRSEITPLEEQSRKWSQFATTSQKYRDMVYLPYAFTEHGIAMLSSVLNSDTAIQMNLFIIRAFIKMRESLETYKDLALKIDQIEIVQLQDHANLRNVHSIVIQLLQKISDKTNSRKKRKGDCKL